MRKTILAIFTLLVTLGIAFTAEKAYACHAAGGEITYQWLSGSTYKVQCKYYRDCGCGTTSIPASLCYSSDCGGSGTVPWTTIGTPVQIVTPCPGQSTTCASPAGTLPGYVEYVLEATVTLPSQCSVWHFSTNLSARNNANNIVGNNNWFVESTLDNMAAQGNSSPVFTVRPVPFVCQGVPYTYNNGASDPNNDSLSYEMVMPRYASGCPAAPTNCQFKASTPPFNLTTNPLDCNNTFVLSQTGQSSFTPSTTGPYNLTITVSEWRGGVKIGSVQRDIQVVVRPCTSVQPVANPVVTGSVGVNFGTTPISGCAGQQFNFCTQITSADTNAWLAVLSNNLAIAPGSVMTYTGIGTDTVLACFNWTPGVGDTGQRILTFSVKDTNCTSNGGIPVTNTFSVPFFINPVTVASNDTTICYGASAQLGVRGGGNFTWTALPGGSGTGSLSCTNCATPIATPTATTTYVVSSGTTSFCNRSKDTVTVFIAPIPSFNAGPDTTTCINNSLQLNANVALPPGSYSILWTPSTFLSNNTIPNPVVTPTSDISYVIRVIPGTAGACAMFDTLRINVVQGYDLATKDTAICEGQSIGIVASGDTRYKYAWSPTQGVSDPNIINPVITPDTSKIYTVTGTFPGCRDSVRSFYLDVHPNPIVFIGIDKTLCYGDTIRMSDANVTPGYPNYIYSWSPAGSFDDPTKLNPVYQGFSTAALTLVVKTPAPANCTGQASVNYSVIPADFLTISADTSICPGDTAQLHVTGDYVGLNWIPTTYIDNTTSADPKVWPVTTTTYSVIGTDINSCLDTQSVQVTIHPRAALSLPDSVTIFPGESYAINPGGNCLYFSWFPLAGLSSGTISNPIASPEVNTRYRVNARTEAGCTVSDSMDVNVSLDSWIDVPNAFSPGSQPNAYFKIVHRGTVVVKAFRIYNRWGTEVFSTNNVDEGWDGTWNGKPQPMGAYIYIVEALSPTGRRFYKQGNLTLIR